jgi:ribosomal protein S18 acetylase RimI-like enzyme
MLERRQVPGVLEISLRELGSDYLSEDDFIEAVDSDDVFCITAFEGEKALGFSVCRVFGPEDVDADLKLPDSAERDRMMSYGRIGLLDSVSVSDAAKGRGVGTSMVEACLSEFSARRADEAAAMAWKSVTGRTNIAGLLLRHGFQPSLEIPGYWNLMVDSPLGHDCPVCGAPCRCSAVLYSRHL